MAAEQETFHIVVEILAIIINVYFLSISTAFKGWKKNIIRIIAIGVILIDVYALLSWGHIASFLPQKAFHVITEALAIPAGAMLIYLSRENINNKKASWLLLGMGIANFVVDGYLFFTWL